MNAALICMIVVIFIAFILGIVYVSFVFSKANLNTYVEMPKTVEEQRLLKIKEEKTKKQMTKNHQYCSNCKYCNKSTNNVYSWKCESPLRFEKYTDPVSGENSVRVIERSKSSQRCVKGIGNEFCMWDPRIEKEEINDANSD